MNYDDYITGLYDPTSPMNRAEIDDCEEESEYHYMVRISRKIKAVNQRIVEIEEIKAMTNSITSDEAIELHNLKQQLNKLIKEL